MTSFERKLIFMCEYLSFYLWQTSKKVANMLSADYVYRRMEVLGKRKTTSIEFYEYDYDLINSIDIKNSTANQSEKVRYLLRLGALAYHEGWNNELPFFDDVIEQKFGITEMEQQRIFVEELETRGKRKG